MGTKIRKIKIHPTYGLDFLVTLPDIVDDVDAWVQDMFLTAESWDYVDEDEQARATIQLTTTNNERFPLGFYEDVEDIDEWHDENVTLVADWY